MNYVYVKQITQKRGINHVEAEENSEIRKWSENTIKKYSMFWLRGSEKLPDNWQL
jgi:hypothetical protein